MIWYLVMVPESQRALLTLGIGHHSTPVRSPRDAHCAGHHCHLGHHRRCRLLSCLSPIRWNSTCRTHRPFSCCPYRHRALESTRERCCASIRHRSLDVSNGVRVPYVSRIDTEGYLAHSNWCGMDRPPAIPAAEAIFRGECGSCHTLNGYRPLVQLLAGPRPRQHRQLHHHAARLQARLALPAFHAAHGWYGAGCR